MTFTPTIGIEVHAELNTKSKMFCGCKNDPHDSEPNINICPICLAHPGTLPTVNKEAVRDILLIGTAINGQIATYSEFDRKNYFYPDIPKAYQISQYAFPFVEGGELDGVAITRIHLEEDTARSLHDKGDDSIVDFNRAGVPLMELVTEPVIHDAAQAGHFARELQLLLRTLGVSKANMERGEMRVEANISVSDNDELGTKVEVKNLNSFRSVESAISHEIERQIEEINQGRAVISETRGWDEEKGRTYSQRTKETADDYRYFPDPDIPKFSVSEVDEFSYSRLSEMMPELPQETRRILSEMGVDENRIEILVTDTQMLSFFREVATTVSDTKDAIKTAVNYLTSDISGILQQEPERTLETKYAPQFVSLVGMVNEGTITSRVAKDLLPEVVFDGADPERLAEERGLTQKNSTDELEPIVATIIEENSSVVAEYKGGKEASLQYLVGQGMKATKGSANPEILKQLLVEKMKG